MKIAITADPQIPVPPELYGGIERIIAMLIDELVKLGHDVTLFAHKDSKVPCRLIPYPAAGQGKADVLRNTLTVTKTVFKEKFDVVHSFGRLAYLTFILPMRIKKIMSYQREPTISQVKFAMKLAYKNSLIFTGCSEYIAVKIRPYAQAYAVPNFVDVTKYELTNSVADDAPLTFLGRVEHIKGTHVAIEVAKASGKKLIIAGNIPAGEEHQRYFDKQIKPEIDGEIIQYIGPVNDKQKNELLGASSAFLMPILWDEPFGIVMAEALACGTPVLAFGRGSVSEVVTDNITGFITSETTEMIKSVTKINRIDRAECRKSAEKQFDVKPITQQYLRLYAES